MGPFAADSKANGTVLSQSLVISFGSIGPDTSASTANRQTAVDNAKPLILRHILYTYTKWIVDDFQFVERQIGGFLHCNVAVLLHLVQSLSCPWSANSTQCLNCR